MNRRDFFPALGAMLAVPWLGWKPKKDRWKLGDFGDYVMAIDPAKGEGFNAVVVLHKPTGRIISEYRRRSDHKAHEEEIRRTLGRYLS